MNNQQRKTDVERLNLHGNVKSYLKTIQENSIKTNDTIESFLKEHPREFLLFNKKGNIVEKVSFKKNGERYKKWNSVYDREGNKIESIEIKYPKDTLKRWLDKYDNSGNEIESLIYDHKDSILSHAKWRYNKSNKKTELIILKSKQAENQLVKVSYEYDDHGNQIKTTRYYTDNSKTEWFTKYDSIGNETEWRIYDRQGYLERKDIYIYDDDSNLLEEKTFNSDNVIESTGISEYDNDGKEIKYTEYLYDSIRSFEVYEYDEVGNKTTKYFNAKGELKSSTQLISESDKNGNLIKESEFENGKLKSTKKYKIEYYK